MLFQTPCFVLHLAHAPQSFLVDLPVRRPKEVADPATLFFLCLVLWQPPGQIVWCKLRHRLVLSRVWSADVQAMREHYGLVLNEFVAYYLAEFPKEVLSYIPLLVLRNDQSWLLEKDTTEEG